VFLPSRTANSQDVPAPPCTVAVVAPVPVVRQWLTPPELVDEAIWVIREAVALATKTVLLFSGGKDSAVLLHLAHLAFAPDPAPLELLHVDTSHNFDETISFRDDAAARYALPLTVASVQDSIDAGRVEDHGGSRNALQSTTLLDAVAHHRYDVILGGARRDEDRARAKERIFSHRGPSGAWDPDRQRPEPWNLTSGDLEPGGQLRVFPLSNWTEADVWRFTVDTGLEHSSLYFAHRRVVVERDGLLVPVSALVPAAPGEAAVERTVRFRTVGDATCTAAVASTASNPLEVLAETIAADVSERGATRIDDRSGDAAMEDRKTGGYF
jgi:sulfate adenylyltransferase subunit 2